MSERLHFSQVHEDPRVEARVIERLVRRLDRPLRVALPASGGCTALSLLSLPGVARIEAIEPRPAQRHLVELKRAGLATLTREGLLALLGAVPAAPDERLALYAEVAPALCAAARDHWAAHEALVASGVNRAGSFEGLLRDLAEALARQGLDPVDHPRDAVLDWGWREAFLTALADERLEAALGEDAAPYLGAAGHLADAFARALWRYLPEENYFLLGAWRPHYDLGRDQLPPYLQAEGHAAARRQGIERLRLHAGAFLETLEWLAAESPFELVLVSTLAHGLPLAERQGFFARVRATLAPGGALVARRLAGTQALAPLIGEHLAVDAAMSHELLLEDRSFWYSELVVAYR